MRQEPPPLTRADLEEIAFAWGVAIDDLWEALEAGDDREDVDAVPDDLTA